MKKQKVRLCVWAPLFEALGVGAIDYDCYTGDAPPIFAQAAHPNLLYAREAIVVPAASSIQDVSCMADKKIAVAKASSADNLLVAALEAERIGHRSSSE